MDIDRRAFFGIAAGVVWTTPAVRSVQAGAVAGTPAPTNTPGTTGTRFGSEGPIPARPSGPNPLPDRTSGPVSGGGTLPMTGADIATKAAVGTAAVVAGAVASRMAGTDGQH